jgi:zinc protease
MKSFKNILLIPFFVLMPLCLEAQIDLGKNAPVDPDIRIGKLENGLTYFIRKNKEPEKRASFYIIQNVGSILEDDNQNGLAHFLEHMAFNGTTHFPGKGIINSLEKHGVAFGYNINAYTGFDETVYNLSNVPVDAPGLIDSCLLILNDWSHYITLSDKEIDLERGVIMEEWRTSKDANRRMTFEIIPVILKDSKYAVRDILGNPDVIQKFSYNTLRDYYHKWYRPDLQAIAIVGDIDVDKTEASIKELFSSIPAAENPAPRNTIEVPSHKETYYVLAQDKEAPQTSVSVINLVKTVQPKDKNLRYIRENYVISLMNSMIDSRIGELLQKDNPPFISGSISFGGYYAREYNAFSISASAQKNEEAKALEAVYSEAERVRQYGFGEGELQRAKADMLTQFENTYKQKDKINNDTYISGIQNYFLSGEPLTSVDFDYEFLKQVIGSIKKEEVSDKFRELMNDENRTMVIQGLEGKDIKHLTNEDALGIISKVKNSKLVPYADVTLSESLINNDLKGSKIIKTVPLPQFDATEWTLSNNTKVIYRRADFEKDNVMLAAYSFGGISKLDQSLVLPANMLSSISPMYGAGDYDNITLQKMLAGEKANLSLSLNETTETISGSSTPKDFEILMQLLYLRMAKPRFDINSHNAIIDRYEAYLDNIENDPDKIKSDSTELIVTDHNPRTRIITKDAVAKISIEDIKKIYTDRFNSADEFTFFIIGNVDIDTVMKYTEKYIGSIPSAGRTETWIDRKIRQPEGKITREISIPLKIPKSTVYISFQKKMDYNPYNYLGLEVIQGILDIVYTEKIREEEGGTYGVGVSLSSRKRPEEMAEGTITFDCEPGRSNELKKIIYNEINSLTKDGPDQINLNKAVNNLLKTREESKLHNSYWLGALTTFYSYGIDSNNPENFENILKSYSVDSIKKIANELFSGANIVDITFVPSH